MTNMFITGILIGLLVCVITYFFIIVNKRPKNYPPGPFKFPVFGYLFFMNKKNPLSTLAKLRDTYGKVFSIKLGTHEMVYVHDFKVAQEVLNHPECQGRPDFWSFQFNTEYTRGGISFSEGKVWNEHKKFTLRHLRVFGLGKSVIEDIIMESVKDMEEFVKSKKGKSFSLSSSLNVAVLNVIWRLTGGVRHDTNDPKFMEMTRNNDYIADAFYGNPLDVLPWLLYIFPGWVFNIPNLTKYRDAILNYCKETLEEHEKNYDASNERDLADVYVGKILQDEKNRIKDSTFTRPQAKYSMVDMFQAGTETTSTQMRFLMLYLVVNPDVQTKLRKEIHEVVGIDRDVSLMDKNRLPYAEATMLEALRIATITPLGVAHKTTSVIKCGDFELPKNTIVIVNQYAIHHNPEYFPEPEKFQPERFLKSDGTVDNNKEGFMPFSLGRRECIGESLARAEMFLLMSNLIQKFKFSVPPGKPLPRTDAQTFGMVVHPYEYEMIAETTEKNWYKYRGFGKVPQEEGEM